MIVAVAIPRLRGLEQLELDGVVDVLADDELNDSEKVDEIAGVLGPKFLGEEDNDDEDDEDEDDEEEDDDED